MQIKSFIQHVLYYPKTQQLNFILCGGHESETSTSKAIYAIYTSPAALSRGHNALSFDAIFVSVWLTEQMDFLFKITGIAASTFYDHKGG